MSRVSPFPTTPNRTRSPAENGDTKPLQISRPVRPAPSSNVSYSSNGPARPQRSELRSRQMSEHSISSTDTRDSIDQRDSTSTESSLPRRTVSRNAKASTSRSKIPLTITMPPDGVTASPTSSITSAVSAFQSAGRRKRTMTNGSTDAEWEREREKELLAEQLRQKRIKDRVPGRRMNGKTKAGDIDAVLDQIKDEWESVIFPDFNPVDLALQLLDDSSLGKDMNSFQDTKHLLSKALKGSVDKHYQAFAAALPHHSSLLTQLSNTQNHIRETRTLLQDAKDSLGSKRADLVQLWSRSQMLEEMTRILDQIEHLKTVADVLESLISEKRLLQAAILLVRSLKIINNHDMNEIGAMADLRTYLNGQETALREILVDELHNHLYLKSVFTGTRWSAYTPNQQTLPKVDYEEEFNETLKAFSAPPGESVLPARFNHFIADLSTRPNDSPVETDDNIFRGASIFGSSGTTLYTGPSFGSNLNLAAAMSNSSNSTKSPESDSFSYMETLLESLAVLGKLGSGLDVVAQRVPSEIFTLVETTLDEVSERADYMRKSSILGPPELSMRTEDVYVVTSSTTPGSFGLSSIGAHALIGPTHKGSGTLLSASSLRMAALEESKKQMDHEILKDFFWTLYSKLDAIAQGMRVVSEVANRIGSRRDFKDSSGAKLGALFPLNEIIIPIHAEVRTLLHDCLTDEEQGSVSGRNPLASINETLREGKFGRDRSKHVFRFADGDAKLTAKILQQHEDQLNRVLKDTVPGLVTGSTDGAVQATLSAVGTDDRMIGPGQHHRLLVHPDASYVSILFQPTLAFLQRVADVLPSGLESAQQSGAVMDDFVLKVYLPQLEDKVTTLFLNAVNGLYAFQPDTASSRLSPQPLIKATTQLMALINSLCAMLRTSPFHKENYSRLILTVVIQLYQRCSDRFQDFISTKDDAGTDSETRIALAAEWAQKPDLHPCLSEIMRIPERNAPEKAELYRQEIFLELGHLKDGTTVEKDNLIGSTRNLATLGSLYTSICWFTTALNTLKAVPETSFSPVTQPSLVSMSAVTPYAAGLPFLDPVAPNERLQLPLSKEMTLRFQALLQTYDQLAEFILFTIRIDIRCRAIHYLDLSMRRGNYYIEREVSEPDPHIIDLNSELGKCEGYLSNSVPDREHKFVFEGLGSLLEHLLINNAKLIRLANANGIKKIIRNVLALQQSIKAITFDSQSDFERAKRYYSLFFKSPADMLDGIKAKKEFTFEQYQVMLKIQCGVDQTMGEAGVSQASDKSYGMHLIDLQRLEMGNMNEDQ